MLIHQQETGKLDKFNWTRGQFLLFGDSNNFLQSQFHCWLPNLSPSVEKTLPIHSQTLAEGWVHAWSRPRGKLNIAEAERRVSGRNITRWTERSHAANLLHSSQRLRNMRHETAWVSGLKEREKMGGGDKKLFGHRLYRYRKEPLAVS